MAKEDRGFASMDRAKQREIASKGGKAAHQKGTAHEWTSEEAREAGRKGGMASHQRRKQRRWTTRASDCNALGTRVAPSVRAAATRTSRFARSLVILAVAFSSGPAHVRPAASCLYGEPIQSKVPASHNSRPNTGRSFNGRTRRSGRRYRGSNPCLPASLARLRRASSGQASPPPPPPPPLFFLKKKKKKKKIHWRSLSRRSSRSERRRTTYSDNFTRHRQTSLGFAELRLGRRVPVISGFGGAGESPLAKSVPP